MKKLSRINEDITDIYSRLIKGEVRDEDKLPYNLNNIKPLDFGLSFLIGSDILRDKNNIRFSIDDVKNLDMGKWRLPTYDEVQELNRKYLFMGSAGHYEIRTEYVTNPLGAKIKQNYIHIEYEVNEIDLPMNGWVEGNIVENNNKALCFFCNCGKMPWVDDNYDFFWWDNDEHDDCYRLRPKQRNIVLLVTNK